MSTDRKLLELAAKAAGITWDADLEVWEGEGERFDWDPLSDDGAALRLAVKLSLKLDLRFDGGSPFAAVGKDDPDYCEYEPSAERFLWLAESSSTGDPAAATRRAIVLAAAEVGRSMA